MNVAEHVARWLGEKDITHAFGIVGGGNVAIWNAIARHQKTRLISVHHEQAASMAATYYYRASGRLPLCLVTTGAGSANAITGVIAAWMDQIPLIVISGNEPSRFFGQTEHDWRIRVKGTQGYRTADVAREFVKYAVQVTDPKKVVLSLEFARMTALKPPRGPIWVDLPKDIQTHALEG